MTFDDHRSNDLKALKTKVLFACGNVKNKSHNKLKNNDLYAHCCIYFRRFNPPKCINYSGN